MNTVHAQQQMILMNWFFLMIQLCVSHLIQLVTEPFRAVAKFSIDWTTETVLQKKISTIFQAPYYNLYIRFKV